MDDPAHPEFWLSRWQQNKIGFHQHQTNPYLQVYWSRLAADPGSSVFVPLCGKSLDMIWLSQQGYHVKGVELSPLAVDDFFTEHGLSDQVSYDGNLVIRGNKDICIYVGDFFHLQAEHLDACRLVYDRACLIAFPPLQRQRYVRQLLRLFPAGVKILLVTLEYEQGLMQGPPFSVNEQELNELFAEYFSIKLLVQNEVIEQNKHLQEKGLHRLQEKVYVLESIGL